jgi:hypothetical protein
MKISAEPKPENPRAVPETKAMAQIASATRGEVGSHRQMRSG